MSASPSSSPQTTLLRVSRVLVWFVYAYVVLCEVILGLGFVLRLFGANPSAGFVQWAYRSLDRVMAPFRGIFTPVELGSTAGDIPAVLDTSILFAMIVYGIVMLALRNVVDWLTRRLLIDRAALAASSPAPSAHWVRTDGTNPTVVIATGDQPTSMR